MRPILSTNDKSNHRLAYIKFISEFLLRNITAIISISNVFNLFVRELCSAIFNPFTTNFASVQNRVGMKMIFRIATPFKVISSIIISNAILVIDSIFSFWWLAKKSKCNQSMNKKITTDPCISQMNGAITITSPSMCFKYA